ncbi:GNAT family protein [Amycolatopsis sp. DG1A-15b]|uniref:GNAT family N-acetyltransferase n=1 Tax=Amycolatopsis sp. DG1A-15b TaxID=3052846 RepID=UPI00255BC3DD|nr:GNAT family protein [Amycolatopsis sp. DG1A-15b]WIX92575.1 GNAT family protein [Amycolatopsis sp. DG1A-15b]
MLKPFSGNKTSLREIVSSDGPALFKIVGDDRVTKFMSFDSRSREVAQKSADDAVERARKTPRTEYYLAITRVGDDELIGTCRIAFSGVQAAKLGYMVAADHWGNGYATDAVSAILDFAFRQLDRHRITAAIGPENFASQAVAKRLGFSREGVLRDHVFTNGAWRDSVLFSILRHEWLKV